MEFVRGQRDKESTQDPGTSASRSPDATNGPGKSRHLYIVLKYYYKYACKSLNQVQNDATKQTSAMHVGQSVCSTMYVQHVVCSP